MNIFEMLHDKYVLPKKPRLFEAFAGIGCQRMAFKRLGIEVDMIGVSEIDKYALQSYMAIHGETKNYGSITDIKGTDLPPIDVFTWSFPCTDLSRSGKQKGLQNTRSGLVYEVLRILQESTNKPKVLIMENVVDLVQTKFIAEFNEIQLELEQMGYTNYVEVMNAKNFGVAQNRDRVFMVSILGDYYYEFPKPFKLEKRLKDYLENEVDEKYYLSDKMLACFTDMTDRNGLVRGDRFNPHDVEQSKYAFAITTLAGNRATDNFIKIPEDTKKGYSEAHEGDRVYINRPHQKRGVVQEGMIQTLKTSGSDVGVVVNAKEKLCNAMLENGNLDKYDMIRHSYTNERMENLDRKESTDGISATLTTRPDTLGVVVPFGSYYTWADNQGNINTQCNRAADENGYALTVACAETGKVFEDKLRIRKLTPLEVWRLMSIDDEDFYKAQASGVSNSQLYKQAGNGIVVDVFSQILKGMIHE